MSKFIFPLQTSTTDGKYHNYFGEFSQDSLMKDGSYEFGISESHSGLFHLEDLSQKRVLLPNTCRLSVRTIASMNLKQLTITR